MQIVWNLPSLLPLKIAPAELHKEEFSLYAPPENRSP